MPGASTFSSDEESIALYIWIIKCSDSLECLALIIGNAPNVALHAKAPPTGIIISPCHMLERTEPRVRIVLVVQHPIVHPPNSTVRGEMRQTMTEDAVEARGPAV